MENIEVIVHAPTSIVVKCDNEEWMQELLDNAETTKTPLRGFLSINFTQNNALFLRKFLTGKPKTIHYPDRAILRYLADEGETALFWNGDLNELRNHKKPRARKTFLELINYLPYRYIDRSQPELIKNLKINEQATVVGKIVKKNFHARENLLTFTIEDAVGQTLSAAFFNQHWLEYSYKLDEEVILTGRYTEYYNKKTSRYYPQLSSPKMDKLYSDRGEIKIIPVYSERKKIGKTWETMKQIRTIFESIPWIKDPIPDVLLEKRSLLSREESYRKIHFPESLDVLNEARKRIIYEELLQLQTFLYLRNNEWDQQKGFSKKDFTLSDDLINSLPYTLTGAQNKAINVVKQRMSEDKPMHMILQGDVSSGKTTVLEYAATAGVSSGFQAAIVAPTDILAGQLFERLKEDIEKIAPHVVVEFLGGKTKNKPDIYKRLKAGQINILVGTHAVIQDRVKFNNLGVVIIDEQHKFGTKQRTLLTNSGKNGSTPDLLIMSATPIPRTMSTVIYGNMDILILDELPAGRLPIETVWVPEPDDAWDKIKEQVKQGHQAYVVTSLVEDSETIDAKSAQETYEMLQTKLPGASIGLMHGKLKDIEKKEVMDDFLNNRINVLVSTTVIEVGVNVPNATIITILNAERFGLASLHQIRGRVGRSDIQSYCYLVGEPNSIEGEERLQALVSSNDGFYIAEKDLEIRGSGKLFGVEQSGESDMMLANIFEHKDIIEQARNDVAEVLESKDFIKEVTEKYHNRNIDS